MLSPISFTATSSLEAQLAGKSEPSLCLNANIQQVAQLLSVMVKSVVRKSTVMTTEAPALDELSALLHGLEEPNLLLDIGGIGPVDDACALVSTEGTENDPRLPTERGTSTSSSDSASDDREKRVETAAVAREAPHASDLTRGSALAAKRRYREKRKQELQNLRQTAEEMSAQVILLLAKGRRTDRVYSARPRWHSIARRQMRRRVEAESLNRELWTQVRLHHTLAKHMESALRMRLSAADAARAMSLVSTSSKPTVELTELDRHLLSAFMAEMDDLYAQVDNIFNHIDMPLGPEAAFDFQNSHKYDRGTSSEYVELVASIVLPFDLSETVEALPGAMQWLVEQVCTPTTVPTPDPNASVAMKYRFGLEEADPAPAYCQSSAMKAFAEEHRVVKVWRAFTEQQNTGDKYMETGWGVAQRLDRDGSSATLLQLCTHIWPMHWTGLSRSCASRRDAYVEAFTQFGQDEVEALVQALENVVVDNLVAPSIDSAIPSTCSSTHMLGRLQTPRSSTQ